MQKQIEELEAAARSIKHQINTFNITHTLPGFDDLTIDQALVYIPQMTHRVNKLQDVAASLPKERIDNMRNTFVDYNVANYDIGAAEKAYEDAQDLLAELQLALDSVNNTESMDIDVSL